MRLDLNIFPVGRLSWGAKTCWQDGSLYVGREELAAIFAADPRLGECGIEIARPGENVRLMNVVDAFEPRVKVEGKGGVFPGLNGGLERVGDGTTNVLKGMAILALESGEILDRRTSILDMVGRASQMTPFSSLNILALFFRQKSGISKKEFADAIMTSSIKATCLVARSTLGQPPAGVERFELGLPSTRGTDLPWIAYIYQLNSMGDMRDTFFYGQNTRGLLPTIIHPNEVMDGAIVSQQYERSYTSKIDSYTHMNHPVIHELYRRNGKDLRFAGVVVTNNPQTSKDKERCASMSAKLARFALGADAVVIAKEGGGQCDSDLMVHCEKCEGEGMRTVIIAHQSVSEDASESDFPLADSSPLADAIVTTGNDRESVKVPRVERLIGAPSGLSEVRVNQGEADLPALSIFGAFSSVGGSWLRCIEI